MDTPSLLAAAFQHHQANRLDEAANLYREILNRDPNHVDALHLLGLVLCKQNHHAEGIAMLRRAVAIHPAFADAHFNLGTVLREQQEVAAAIESFRTAIRYRPDYAEAYFNLGNALRDIKDPSGAAAAFEAALKVRPNYAKARTNLGQLYLDHKHFAKALVQFEAVVQLQPQSANAFANLSAARRQLGELDAAANAALRALELDQRCVEAANNLGAALLELGDTAKAETWFDAAIQWRPDHAKARLNRGLARLIQGDLRRGWEDYEWRWRCPDFTPRYVDRPAWDGSSLQGRTILLHTEQGVGDTLLFVRYAKLLAELGGKVLLECDRSLHAILATCPGVAQLISRGDDPPPFDVHAPLLSLPWLCGTTFDSIPATVPYLQADEQRIARWKESLEAIPARLKVGIQWLGNPQNAYHKYRRIPLQHFAALSRLPDVQLVSLQKDVDDRELAEFCEQNSLIDLASQLDCGGDAFVDTAAVLKNLDLVVTSDTALAHLAGALGVRTCVVLPFAAEWRWWRDRDDSPWYPHTKLFRQTQFGQWETPFQRLAEFVVQR